LNGCLHGDVEAAWLAMEGRGMYIQSVQDKGVKQWE
jgi:hypothetical protein